MSGFDLPPLGGIDPGSLGRMLPRQFQPEQLAQGLQGVLGVPGQGPGEPGPRRVGIDTSGDHVATPFSGVLADSIDRVGQLQQDTKDKVRGLVMGEGVELHDVLIAGSKSEAAFNLLLEVRNKLVDAWEKLSRSSV